MSDNAPPASAMAVFYRIWREGKSTPGFGLLVSLSLVAAMLNGTIILPIFMQQITSLLPESANATVVFGLLLLCFALLLGGYAAEWMASRLAAKVNHHICLRLMDRQVDGCIRSSLEDFQNHPAEQYLSAVSDVAEVLQSHQLFVLQTAILSIAVTALSLLVLAFYDVWFLAVTLPLLLAICGLPILLAARAGRYIAAEPTAFAALGNYLETLVGGRREWHFAPVRDLLNQADRLMERVHHAQTGKWWIWNLSFNLKLTQNVALNALTLLVSGLLYVNGQISMGTAVGGYLMVTMVAPKFDSLYKLYNFAQASGAAYHVLDRLTLPTSMPAPVPAMVQNGERIHSVRLDVSNFAYGDVNSAAIKHAALDLRVGDRCLITGASGSGKSTLIDLLIGSRSAPTARLLVNYRPISDFGLDQYWCDIAYVPNPDLLFDDLTAQENLALFGRTEAEQISTYAKQLGWDDFRFSLASQMSGGERQRLSVLRALSRDCNLLVLDEPTSALDEANAQTIFRILSGLAANILVVASHGKGIEHHFNRRFELQHGILLECE